MKRILCILNVLCLLLCVEAAIAEDAAQPTHDYSLPADLNQIQTDGDRNEIISTIKTRSISEGDAPLSITAINTVDSINVVAGGRIKLDVTTEPVGLEESLTYSFTNSNLAEIDGNNYILGKFDKNLGPYGHSGLRSTTLIISAPSGVKKEVEVNVKTNQYN